jgi:hypothetical protein
MISNWTVCIKDDKYHAEKIPGDIEEEDLIAEGWEPVGYVAFHNASDAITYCKQMDFKPRKRKLVRRRP